ncbi:MAG: hypothetical protein AB8B69_14060 [Chitinophagales bacterium]
MKTKQELLDFAIEKRKKGSTYRAIRNLLSIECKEECLLQEIIEEVEDLERKRELKVKRTFPVDHYASNDNKALRNILFIVLGLGVLMLGGGAETASAIKLVFVGVLAIFKYI